MYKSRTCRGFVGTAMQIHLMWMRTSQLMLLSGSQLQIFRKASKFLVIDCGVWTVIRFGSKTAVDAGARKTVNLFG